MAVLLHLRTGPFLTASLYHIGRAPLTWPERSGYAFLSMIDKYFQFESNRMGCYIGHACLTSPGLLQIDATPGSFQQKILVNRGQKGITRALWQCQSCTTIQEPCTK